jgi:PIN like domain
VAGTSGWAVFMKDTRVRYNPAERSAVLRHSVQCFCLTSQSLSSVEMARRFIDNLDAIAQVCADDEGPFIYAVHSNRIERLRLDDA